MDSLGGVSSRNLQKKRLKTVSALLEMCEGEKREKGGNIGGKENERRSAWTYLPKSLSDLLGGEDSIE